jgi:hypothetical protein
VPFKLGHFLIYLGLERFLFVLTIFCFWFDQVALPNCLIMRIGTCWRSNSNKWGNIQEQTEKPSALRVRFALLVSPILPQERGRFRWSFQFLRNRIVLNKEGEK